jgi:hypothetical protein
MDDGKIGDILSKLKLPEAQPSYDDSEEKSKFIWLERNLENLPVYFTGSEKTKFAIEKKITEEKKPYVIAKIKTDNGYKMLALNPSGAYGLMDGDDAKVAAAVRQYLQEEIQPKLGYIPKRFLITPKKLCEIMLLTKTGPNYNNIIKSLETIDSCAIIQQGVFRKRLKKGEDIIEEKKFLHILRVRKIEKVDRKTHKGLKNKEYKIEIELEDWMIKNLENYYATKVDKELFFEKLTSQRSRRLLTFLSAFNYQKEAEIDTDRIIELLWIMEKEGFRVKEALTRSIEPLVEAGFLESYEVGWDKIRFVFSKVRTRKNIMPPEDKAKVDSITLKILEELGDMHSERLYKLIARKIPEDVIFLCLSEVKEMGRQGQIKRSKGAIFVEMIVRECKKRGIKVPFRPIKTSLF